MTPLEYAKKCCDTMIDQYPQADLPPEGRFTYHAGVFLSGMERTFLLSGEEKYSDYIHKWLDLNVSKDGVVRGVTGKTLDELEACNLVIRFYKNGEEYFKKVLDRYVPTYLTWPCNQYGGFWHMERFPNQMWLDGLYMAGPLAVQYGLMEGKEEYIQLIHCQLELMWKYIRDEETGLLYHAWDASGKEDWADPVTGCGPEFWGRALGWYLVASADMSEMLPENHPLRQDFLDKAVSLAKAVAKYQDEETGLWYQVVNKGSEPGNWLETSCSCLYVYGLANLVRRRLLGTEYKAAAIKGYEGILKHKIDYTEDRVIVKDVCIGTGVGDYTHYINRPTKDNDLHGTGAFVLMCTEYEKMNR